MFFFSFCSVLLVFFFLKTSGSVRFRKLLEDCVTSFFVVVAVQQRTVIVIHVHFVFLCLNNSLSAVSAIFCKEPLKEIIVLAWQPKFGYLNRRM